VIYSDLERSSQILFIAKQLVGQTLSGAGSIVNKNLSLLTPNEDFGFLSGTGFVPNGLAYSNSTSPGAAITVGWPEKGRNFHCGIRRSDHPWLLDKQRRISGWDAKPFIALTSFI
jgi:hypothetical protein